MMSKKVLKSIEIEKSFSTTWSGLQWTVLAIYERKFLWFHWDERVAIVGPLTRKEEAKRCAKRLRKTHNL